MGMRRRRRGRRRRRRRRRRRGGRVGKRTRPRRVQAIPRKGILTLLARSIALKGHAPLKGSSLPASSDKISDRSLLSLLRPRGKRPTDLPLRITSSTTGGSTLCNDSSSTTTR
jgi:hypothetical protein